MTNFNLQGYTSIIPNLLYQCSDHMLIASRQEQASKERIVGRVIEAAQWLSNIYDKSLSDPESLQISTIPLVEETLVEYVNDFDLISKIASNDNDLTDYLNKCIPIDHNPGQKVLYLEIGKIDDYGVEMLKSYDDKNFKMENGDEANIVDLASQLIEGNNSMDIVLGLDDDDLPCHGDLVYLIDEHGVDRSNTIKIIKFRSSFPDVKLVLESLYGGNSSVEQIKSLYSSSNRDLNTVSTATIVNFMENYQNVIYENFMGDGVNKDQNVNKDVNKNVNKDVNKDHDLDYLLEGVEGAEKWNWGGNKGES